MANILYVWELGGGLGHISRAAPLIAGLGSAGHRVRVALRDLARATTLLDARDIELLQCPLWLHQLKGLPDSATYAELLFRAGFWEPDALEGLTRAWRTLFAMTTPDLMIADHAPNAFLAARGLPFRRALIGNGFFSPPRQTPLPAFRSWEQVPPARIASADARALDSANQVLDRLGAPRLERLCDLIDVDEDFLCTWPELDHYPARGEAHYWGPTMERERGVEPLWPEGDEPRVFAYVKSDYRELDPLLAALRRLPARTLVYAPGLTLDRVRRFSGPKLRFSETGVRMGAAAAAADLLICNAGEGTVAAALLAGTPLLTLPMHAEQYITGRNVERSGAGISIPPNGREADFSRALQALLGNRRYRDTAAAFAAAHADFIPEQVSTRMLARCEELLAMGPRPV